MVGPCLNVYGSNELKCLPSVNGTIRLQIIAQYSNAAVLKWKCAAESPGDLGPGPQIAGPHIQIF